MLERSLKESKSVCYAFLSIFSLDPIKEMKTLNHSISFTYLQLLDVLMSDFPEKEITVGAILEQLSVFSLF